jgi:hypothetical protein
VKSSSRVYFSACAALIAYTLLYTLPIYARLPRAFYDPVAHRWQWAWNLGPIPMGYVGQIFWGLAGGAIAALIAALITARFKHEPGDRAFGLWAAWALTAVGIIIAYFTWNNWP